MGRKHYLKNINHIVSKEEAEAMIFQENLYDNPVRNSALIATFYLTGGRPVELTRLRKKDISLGENYFIVTVYTAKLGRVKGFYLEDRRLEFSNKAPLAKYLLDYAKELKLPESLLFPITPTRMKQIVYRSSLNQFCPYNFRHSRISKLERSGATMGELMVFKGARDLRSVSAYIGGKAIGRKLTIE